MSQGWDGTTTIRQYDPALGRFLSPDVLTDEYPAWSPYTYTLNNPILFVDPTGAFTEIFDLNGKKVGEDENGNDGNVSIATDRQEAKRIAKDYKNGGIATAEDVASGIQTTKTVLGEALDVLNRTEANGGLREEVSVVTGEGEIVRGETGPEPKIESVGGVLVQTAETKVPALPEGAKASDVTTIHSHPTKIVEQDGQAFPQSASTPSGADRSTFKNYGTNIIVGPIGVAKSVSRDASGNLATTPSRSNGAVIYQRGKAPAEIRRRAVRKIIKQTIL